MKDRNQIQQKNQFPDSILDSLFAHFGFTNLTEIQKKASPIILQKKDCLVIAPTGSGKTECSIIPIFSLVKKSKKLGKIAITVISGYGVGADTAARILRNMVDEEHLFKQIYEAERQYVVTRGFWDS